MTESYHIDSPLYWDIPRIDDYLDQFSSLDLNGTMTGGKLGVGGPTIVTGEISQVPFTRPKRDREKVTEFERYLRRHNRIKQGRPTGPGPFPTPDFWEDTFRARKIEFKGVDPNDTAADNVILWIADLPSCFSTSPLKPRLYLIQEYRGINDHEFPRFTSGYARLKALERVFRKPLGKPVWQRP